MTGLIGILILGWCVWMLITHPLKSLSILLKIGFFFLVGLGTLMVAFYFVVWW